MGNISPTFFLGITSHRNNDWSYTMPNQELLNDGDIARHLKVSKSCIRGQRHKRRRGLGHWLTIDPVMVGRGPRYRAPDFMAWFSRLETTPATPTPNGQAKVAA